MQVFFTVCNREELAGAIVLGKSVLQQQPKAIFIIGWADAAALPVIPDPLQVIHINDLGIKGLKEMAQAYKTFEFVHAVRPWFAHYILEKHASLEFLGFLAPSTLLLQPVNAYLKKGADVMVTPHITAGIKGDSEVDDKRILNIGMFHADAWFARYSEATLFFLNWWKQRTLDRGYFDLCNGMCMDQLWLNYTTVLVPNYHIIRDTGWCVGLHNLSQVKVSQENGVWNADKKPLVIANMAGFFAFHPVWSNHVRIAEGATGWKVLKSTYKSLLQQESVTIMGTNTYGQEVEISSQRLVRKDMVRSLQKIVNTITDLKI